MSVSKSESTPLQIAASLPTPFRDKRRERLETPQFQQVVAMVWQWIDQRPLMAWADSRAEVMADLFTSEIVEYLAELNVVTQDRDQVLERLKELFDAIFFLSSFLFQYRDQVELAKIQGMANGQARNFDLWLQATLLQASLLAEGNLRAAEEVLATVWSQVAHERDFLPPALVMDRVVSKNTRNHPKEVYQKWGYIFYKYRREWVRTPMAQDRLVYEQNFAHRVRCMRLIRVVMGLAGRDLSNGLEPSDWKKYMRLITTLKDHELFYGVLQAQLLKHYPQVVLADVMSQVGWPHGVIGEQAVAVDQNGGTIFDSRQPKPESAVATLPNQVATLPSRVAAVA